MESKRGQLTHAGIIFMFISIFLYWALLPTIYSIINDIVSNATANGDTTTATIMPLIPVFMGIGILVIPIVYSYAGERLRNR